MVLLFIFLPILYILFAFLFMEIYSAITHTDPDLYDVLHGYCEEDELYKGILIMTFWPIVAVIGIIKGIIIGVKYLVKAIIWYVKILYTSIKDFLQKNIKIK